MGGLPRAGARPDPRRGRGAAAGGPVLRRVPSPVFGPGARHRELGCRRGRHPRVLLGFRDPSADAIRVSEARLVKRAERRQRIFGAAWCEVMRLALLVRDGSVPPEARSLVARWRDAATPTRAAQADAVMKLVSAGVLPPNSEVTYELLGYDRTTITRLAAETRRARTEQMMQSLFSAPEASPEVAGLTQAGAADVDDTE
ncbi:phage portal protein [Klebsiella pneumoniae]|nr:phage portal protein [Klebsiella pneumoniae]